MQAREHTKVPRRFTASMRSRRFTGVSSVPVREIALALLTRTSSPPNVFTAVLTAAATASASRTSNCSASALPPAVSISFATVWMVPGSFGCGSADLPVTTTFAPSHAKRSAISRPMPRVAPVMNTVFPCNLGIRTPQSAAKAP